jgi:hypothetical protein
MRAYEVAEDRKRKRAMLVLVVLPEVPHGLHATRGIAVLTSVVLGQLPIVLAASAVQPNPFYITVAAGAARPPQ